MTVIKVFFGFLVLPAPRIGHNLLSSVALLKPKIVFEFYDLPKLIKLDRHTQRRPLFEIYLVIKLNTISYE